MRWDSPPSQQDTSQLFPLTRAAGRFVNPSLTFANDIVKLALTSRHFFLTCRERWRNLESGELLSLKGTTNSICLSPTLQFIPRPF